MFDFWKKRRRRELQAVPFPEAHRVIMLRNVPYLRELGDDDRSELEGLVKIFLAEKSFEGAGGLEMTDEIRVTIAAQACLLLLHRETDLYPELDSIVVYPRAYRAPTQRRDGLIVIEENQVRLGESWSLGTIVLAWDHVLRGASSPHDGHNVVLHEFAHQLDAEGGDVDGAPDLGARARYVDWAKVLGAEFEELSNRVHAGRPSDIDAYGATSPPEFFAVVTEMFFEQGVKLRRRHPELYEELRDFYKQDPAAAGDER